MVLIDRHRMFYKGLVPIWIAGANLIKAGDYMNIFRTEKNFYSNFIWPFLFSAAMLLVHPFFLIGIRVQCADFHWRGVSSQKPYKYSITAAQHIMKTQGIRGFYKGFGPSFILYCILSYT